MKITKEIADKIIAEIKATPKDELRKRYENTESILPDDFHMGCNCSEEISALKARLADAVQVVEWYADSDHWTIDWVEGSHGDYGNRARAFLKAYRAARGEGENGK